MRALLFTFFAMLFVVVLAVMGIMLIYDALRSYWRQGLEEALQKLGWEQDEDDLWQNQKTGIITSFQHAVRMELQTSLQAKKIFGYRFFKTP